MKNSDKVLASIASVDPFVWIGIAAVVGFIIGFILTP